MPAQATRLPVGDFWLLEVSLRPHLSPCPGVSPAVTMDQLGTGPVILLVRVDPCRRIRFAKGLSIQCMMALLILSPPGPNPHTESPPYSALPPPFPACIGCTCSALDVLALTGLTCSAYTSGKVPTQGTALRCFCGSTCQWNIRSARADPYYNCIKNEQIVNKIISNFLSLRLLQNSFAVIRT